LDPEAAIAAFRRPESVENGRSQATAYDGVDLLASVKS